MSIFDGFFGNYDGIKKEFNEKDSAKMIHSILMKLLKEKKRE